MGAITSWCLKKGLGLALHAALPSSGVTEEIGFLRTSLAAVSAKLDCLVDAPFIQAKMHLRQGDPEKCMEKLIEAISLNELDLPALALYCGFLAERGKIDLALEYWEEILSRFGPHEDLLPADFLRLAGEYFRIEKPLREARALRVSCGAFPTTILASLGGFAGIWAKGDKREGCSIYSWDGTLIPTARDAVLLGLTQRYAIVAPIKAAEIVEVVRLKDGSRVPREVTAGQAAALFRTAPPFVESSGATGDSAPLLDFGGVKLTAEASYIDLMTTFGARSGVTLTYLVVENPNEAAD